MAKPFSETRRSTVLQKNLSFAFSVYYLPNGTKGRILLSHFKNSRIASRLLDGRNSWRNLTSTMAHKMTSSVIWLGKSFSFFYFFFADKGAGRLVNPGRLPMPRRPWWQILVGRRRSLISAFYARRKNWNKLKVKLWFSPRGASQSVVVL